MTSTALLTLYRSLTRHKLHAVLSIGGLALGIAVFLVLYLFVQNERGYDRQLPGSENIYVMTLTYDLPGIPELEGVDTMAALIDFLRADYPGLQGTRLKETGIAVQKGASATSEQMALVDSNFFDLFPYPVIAGDAAALSDPDSIAITEDMARKYFRDPLPVGETIALTVYGETRSFQVGAILKQPAANRSFDQEIFGQYVRERYADENFDNWGSQQLYTFVQLPDANAAAAMTADMPAFIDRHTNAVDVAPGQQYSDIMTMQTRPLHDVHLMRESDRTVVVTLGVVGILTLLIAIVNYINLATARAGLRAREVAIRKVLGGTQTSLVIQFMTEAIATVAFASLIGLALTELSLPFVNSLGGTDLGLTYWGAGSILPPLIMMVLIVGLLAGLYPAFILSGFQPAAVLASARAPGGGRAGQKLRRALVVMQFSIAVAFMIGTLILLAQTRHLEQADLGFQRDGLITVHSFQNVPMDDSQGREMLAAFRAIDGVTSVAVSNDTPGVAYSTSSTTIQRPGENMPTPSLTWVRTGPGYFDTYGARLIAGRDFRADIALDDTADINFEDMKANTYNIILSRAGARDLGFASPEAAIGEIVQSFGAEAENRVIGVVDDMRFRSPREALRPMMYFYESDNIDGALAALRFEGRPARDVLADVEATWKRIAPAVPFSGNTASQTLYNSLYKADAQRSRLFTIGAVLAVLIGCIGLYGLASFDTARRVKEIGIRKTLGASTKEILRLLIGQFLRPVLIANLIAWPLAYLAMSNWLNGFDDRVALSPFFFIGASFLALIIAAVTIFGQSWRVARAEPARALRYE
ncbi:ABC transporter permease [Pacificimonas sp. WHA3]|uniref:ABC transporter permease n=1 Tax=Pacificimonas pallii TaxID=2827236 RepID=A0ABS6SG91_9SPHN|nr:ABC transporter permease [Pacificimonas pallii]MBV7257410.1 ABC transporter permease [Pacificimonas pallii]